MASAYDPLRKRLWTFSGSDGTQYVNDVWFRDLGAASTWTHVTTAGTTPPEHHWASMVYDGVHDRLIVFGGATGPGALQNDTWALNLSGASPTWQLLAPTGAPPVRRERHGAMFDPLRDRMIVFGGYGDTGPLNDTWSLDFSGPTPAWSPLTLAAPPVPRFDAPLVYDPVGDRVVLFGGDETFFGPTHLDQETWTLSLSGTMAWSQATPSGPLPPARRQHSLCYDSARGRVILLGGFLTSGYVGDEWALDLATMAWTPLAVGNVISPRGSFVATYDPGYDRILGYGGRNEPKTFGDEFDLVFTSSSVWPGPPVAPTSRFFHAASYDPSRHGMVVFGGFQSGNWLNDAYELDLGPTPTWHVIQASGSPPTARGVHAQVIDPVGDRLVVFGGKGVSGVTNDTWQVTLGGAPTWSRAVPLGATAPTPRESPAFAYDSKLGRMIVFGGLQSGGATLLNDVWALSLGATPAWTFLASTSGSPAARYSATAIYDSKRDRIVLFGGTADGIAWLSDVWIFDFASGAWSAVSTSGTPPSGRYAHQAIYDPVRDRMVVFGGYNGNFLNDVWELSFSNATPGWSPLLPVNTAPTARDFLSAIYDPGRDRLVLFGGNTAQETSGLNDTWELDWRDQPTPVLTSLVDASTTPGAAHLCWQTSGGAGVAAEVERSADGLAWISRAQLLSNGSGLFVFDDVVQVGGRYGYRLLIRPTREQTEVTWLDVPPTAAGAPGLAGAWPNPAHGAPHLSFTLAGKGPAKLAVFDVTGRRVYARAVDPLGAGMHVLDLGGALPARAGVYVAVLSQGAATTRTKFVILP